MTVMPGAAAVLLALLLTLSAGSLGARPALPSDVMRFTRQRDLCDHYRQEEPYDDARRKFLQEGVRSSCSGTDRTLWRLKAKYRANPIVLRRLAGYEPSIEAAPK